MNIPTSNDRTYRVEYHDYPKCKYDPLQIKLFYIYFTNVSMVQQPNTVEADTREESVNYCDNNWWKMILA